MTRGQAWEGASLRALQAATATSWGDGALHAFAVQQKAQAELQKKMPLVCVDVGHGGVSVLLSPGMCPASPPCHASLAKLTFSWLLHLGEQEFL